LPLRCSVEPHPLSRDHLARQGQVGVGVDPTLDDEKLYSDELRRSQDFQSATALSGWRGRQQNDPGLHPEVEEDLRSHQQIATENGLQSQTREKRSQGGRRRGGSDINRACAAAEVDRDEMQIGFKPANGGMKFQMVTDRGRVTYQQRRDKADSGTGIDGCRHLLPIDRELRDRNALYRAERQRDRVREPARRFGAGVSGDEMGAASWTVEIEDAASQQVTAQQAVDRFAQEFAQAVRASRPAIDRDPMLASPERDAAVPCK
jgi:hypothetical protein